MGVLVDVAAPPQVRAPVRVPWGTVLPLAVVVAFADQFWTVALRGAVGSIARTDAPFTTWLRESTVLLPVYACAVLAALALALRWFASRPRRWGTTASTLTLVVALVTVTGIAVLVADAAYGYHLQAAHLATVHDAHGACGADCLSLRQQATLDLHVRAVGLGSLLLLLTNLLLVGLVVAFRGGRLDLASARRPQFPRLHRPVRRGRSVGPRPDVAGTGRLPRRIDEVRVFLTVALLGAAAIHNVVDPYVLPAWPGARTAFGVLCAAEVIVAFLVVARLGRSVALAAAVVSGVPLVLWLWSRTLGLPFGSQAGVAEPVGLVDTAASVLAVATVLAALVVLRAGDRLQLPSAVQHPSRLALVAVVAVTVLGLASGVGTLTGASDIAPTSQHSHGV